jgi:serine/threonine protein kinase
VILQDFISAKTLEEALLDEQFFETPSSAVRFVKKLAERVTALHQANLAHGDLKPSNIIFLAPGLLTAVLVHAPIGGPDSLPVPLGIVSFDERVVQRAQEKLANCLPHQFEVSGKLRNTDPRLFVEAILVPAKPAAPDYGKTPQV